MPLTKNGDTSTLRVVERIRFIRVPRWVVEHELCPITEVPKVLYNCTSVSLLLEYVREFDKNNSTRARREKNYTITSTVPV